MVYARRINRRVAERAETERRRRTKGLAATGGGSERKGSLLAAIIRRARYTATLHCLPSVFPGSWIGSKFSLKRYFNGTRRSASVTVPAPRIKLRPEEYSPSGMEILPLRPDKFQFSDRPGERPLR